MRPENATRYAYPSAAWLAVERFLTAPNRDPRDWRFDVVNTRTGKSVYGTADGSLPPKFPHQGGA